MAKWNKLYHLKWNINAWDTAMPLDGRNFVRHLGICYQFVSNFYNSCALSLRTIQWKNGICYRIVSNFYESCALSLRTIQWKNGICYRISVKLLQLMCAVITHNSVKNEVSILINGWVIANYSVSWPQFCPPSWNLLSVLCQTLTGYARCHSEQLKKRSLYLKSNVAYTHTQHTHTQHTHTHTHAYMTTA